MAPNSCSFESFESLNFNPFHNESFSDTKDERDPDEHFLMNSIHRTSNVLIFHK